MASPGDALILGVFPSRSCRTGCQSPSMVLSRSSRNVGDAEDHGRCEKRRHLSWPVGPVELGDSNGAPGRRFSWTLQDLGKPSAFVAHCLAVPIAVPEVDFCS